MRYKLLGSSGLRVSELCLGTMTFGSDWGWGATPEECRAMFDLFVERGGNFIDTANNYTDGSAETIVGELVAAERDRFVIGTKYTLCKRRGDPNACGNHRKNMRQSIEASLKRLQTDHVDLYWVHAWDFSTPVEEVLRGLDDLTRAGKVLHAAVSDTPAWVIAQGNTLAGLRGWSPFVALQAPYNLLERELEGDMLPMARAFGIAVLAWGPLSSGKLSGKHSQGAKADSRRMRRAQLSERETAIIGEVVSIAGEIGCSPAQVAINWLRQQPAAAVIPVVGARTVDQMRDNLGCLDFSLTADQLARLDRISTPELGFPHDFLAAETPRGLIYGEYVDQIDGLNA